MLIHIKGVLSLPQDALQPSERLTLLVLAYYAGKLGRVYPKNATLVASTGLSLRAVQYAINRLMEMGYLLPVKGKQGRREFLMENLGVQPLHPPMQPLHPRHATLAPHIKGVYEGGKLTVNRTGDTSQEGPPMKGPTSIKEVMKTAKEPPKRIPSTAVGKLCLIWKSRVGMEYSSGGMITLTKKDEGQLKLFAQKVGFDKAPEVLNKVLDDWFSFCGAVKEQTTAVKTPSMPHIGFLLANSNVALDLITKPATAHLYASEEKIAVNCTQAEVFDPLAFAAQFHKEDD